jgi:glutamate--cysteine ligase catalytic subunit
MRFKPPPPNSPIGWRVEFRPCEIQLTDFENAAIVCFIVLVTRVILSYQLNFLIPISKVDENMAKSQKRNALKTEKFWFRKNITAKSDASSEPAASNVEDEYELMTIDQIINGKVVLKQQKDV